MKGNESAAQREGILMLNEFSWYDIANVERVFQTFDSHQDADKATLEYYRSLTPQERIDIALDLMQSVYEAHPRFERIYRSYELGECPVSSDWRVGV